MCFAINPISEVEDIGTSVVAADSKIDCPQPTRGQAAGIDPNRATKLSTDRIEGIDLAMEKAEVADQQMTSETAETGRCQGDPPWRGKAASGDQFLDEVAVFIKDRNRPCAEGSADLVGASSGCINDINVAPDVPHIERDEPSRQRGVNKGASIEA